MRVRRGRKGAIDNSRLMFINGQIAKGNLKSKREQSRGEIMQRIVDRMIVNELAERGAPPREGTDPLSSP